MSNYARGYQAEYRIVQEFKKKGWAIRSPASKGLFDVVGICKDGVFLIQAKRSKKKVSPSKYKEEIQKIQQWIRDLPYPQPKWLHVQLWIWQDYQGWTKFEIKAKSIKKIGDPNGTGSKRLY